MTYSLKRALLLLPLMAPVVLAGCVSQSDYDALKAQNTQLQQQLAAKESQVTRLQGAITYTVNSELLFPSGSWQLSPDGKDIIGRLAKKLAPDQQDKVIVSGYTDNTPIGTALQRQGVTSNQILSKKRADAVMQYMISQGVKPDLVAAQGFGDAQPVASNTTAQGRAQNRRVVVSVAAPGAAPAAEEPSALPERPNPYQTPCPPTSGGCG